MPCTRSLIKRRKERNGTEWKKLIKHGTEQLSQHKVLPLTHSPLKLAHANCSCTQRGLLTHLAAGNGWKADYSIPAHIRTISVMRQLSTMMMMMKIQCCNALTAATLKNTVHILARRYLENVAIIIKKIIMEIKL